MWIWWHSYRSLLQKEFVNTLTHSQVRDVMSNFRNEPKLTWRAQLITIGKALPIVIVVTFLRKWSRQYTPPELDILAHIATLCLTILIMMLAARSALKPLFLRSVRRCGHDICISCGYWLRGLENDAERCPECGDPRPGA
jgi:hypothetical protein